MASIGQGSTRDTYKETALMEHSRLKSNLRPGSSTFSSFVQLSNPSTRVMMYGAFLRCLFLALPIWICSALASPANITHFTPPPSSPSSTGSLAKLAFLPPSNDSWPPIGVAAPVDYSHYPPKTDEYIEIMSYGASFPPSAAVSNPILDGIMTIWERLPIWGLDDDIFAMLEGPVTIRFTLIQPVTVTIY